MDELLTECSVNYPRRKHLGFLGINTMKCSLSILFLVLILFGGSSCAMNPTQTIESTESGGKETTVNKDTARILRYLEDKYGEQFSYAGQAGNSIAGIYKFYVSCESMPNQMIMVVVDNNNDDSCTIRDNYLQHKFDDDIRSFLTEEIQNVFHDYKIYYYPTDSVPQMELPSNATLEQVLNDPGTMLNVKVEVRSSELTSIEKAEKCISTIKGFLTEYYFVFVSVDESNFGRYTNDELNELISHDNFEHSAVFTRINGNMKASWNEGVIE